MLEIVSFTLGPAQTNAYLVADSETRDAAVIDPASRHDLQISDARLGIGPAVGLDESDHDVDAFASERVRIFDHRVGLADAWRGANVDAETGTLSLLQLRQRLLARGAALLQHGSMLTREGGAKRPSLRTLYDFLPYELFTDF